ncbi:serine/threonine protein kinase [Archangium gephyra]|nr:serine/threonine protein kinase [Archangium gephyra]
MSEPGVGRHMDEQERHRVLERLRMRRLLHDSPEQHLPRGGMEIAGYQLEARLGAGGQGTVFRARREGRLFAVKFIYLPRSAHWAWRELDVMVKLWRAGGLPLEGHGLWPAEEPLFLFLVTPLVRGLPLDVWVRERNPNARQVAEVLRWGARQLAVVHAAGVVHRDVKGANLLVRHEDGQLVLVDFGVASYEGAPVVTGPMPPGTWPYLSPRVWRAWRGEEESRASPGDDVWALGVELYLILTGRLPFQGREGELVHAILHEEPEAPHEYNPRVPRALGEVCQRMLRKQPEQRYADARAVDAVLEEVLKQTDEAWEVPLCEAWGPHNATTAAQPECRRMAGDELLALYERLASYARRPVRGKPLPPDEVSTLASRGPSEPPPPRTPDVSATRSWKGLRVAGAVLVLGCCLWLAVRLAPRDSVPDSLPGGIPREALPLEFYPISLVPIGQEVASPWRWPEGDGGAAPSKAVTPAPVARATPSKDTRVKTSPKASAPQPQPKQAGSSAGTVGGVLLSCTLATGCPGPSTPQVRPTLPPPTPCPESSMRTMKELGVYGRRMFFSFHGREPKDPRVPVTVRSGSGVKLLFNGGEWGHLRDDAFFFGELFVGQERVYGRFTEVQTPEGSTYHVCMELFGQDGNRGLPREKGSGTDTARVLPGVILKGVEEFGVED